LLSGKVPETLRSGITASSLFEDSIDDFSPLLFIQHFMDPALQDVVDFIQHPFTFAPSSLLTVSVFVVCFSAPEEVARPRSR